MNMFDGLVDGSGQLKVEPGFLRNAIGSSRLERIRQQNPGIGAVVVGVRPEYLQLSNASEAANAVVELVEPLGQDTYVYLRADDMPFVAVTKRTMLRVGDRVEVHVDEANVQVMDKESGKNVAAWLDGE